MLQVCLNGARARREHHHLPVRPEELARAAATSVAAGADDIHLHPKSPDGTDSLEASIVAATLRAVRAAAPGVAVGITTGAWTTPDPEERVAAIRSWTVLPDHASVNWHEQGAENVADALLTRGVGVEAGLWSGTSGEASLLDSPLRNSVLRVLAEVTDLTSQGAMRTAEAFVQRLHNVNLPVLLHGEAAGAWPVLALAGKRGLHTRIGFEDTLQLPDGSIADDNAELVAAALTRLAAPR